MIFGEHAVLHNQKAIVAAINQRITVELIVRFDEQIVIDSNLGNLTVLIADLNTQPIPKSFSFVIAAIKHFQADLKQGFDLTIKSDFGADLGLGSSAAVTVCVIAALKDWIDATHNLEWIFKEALSLIREVQGMGSGADVAASVFGSCLLYQQNSTTPLEKLTHFLPLSVIYSGSKTPTPEVVQQVNQFALEHPALIQRLYASIGDCVEAAAVAIKNEDWKQVGTLMNCQHELIKVLHLSTPVLEQIIDTLRQQLGIWGAKISGAGLGDCVIGVGDMETDPFLIEALPRMATIIPLSIEAQGLCYG